jgi:cation diffusion facilitator family transporter
MASRASRRSKAVLIAWLSVFINLVVFAFKYWVGLQSNSVAMVADAWHTLSDTLTSLVLILGFWLAAKPPDEEHPFGHGRVESVACIIIAAFLGMVGFNFLRESLLRLQGGEVATFGAMALWVFAISTFVKEGLAELSIWYGRRANSEALVADGWHHRSDAFTNVLILAGALFGSAAWWIDGFMGICVSLMILYITYTILRDATSSLCGEDMEKDERERLQRLVNRISPKCGNPHHIHLHKYGGHSELTLHVDLPPDMKISEAHDVAECIEDAVRKDLGMEATVHVEPASK